MTIRALAAAATLIAALVGPDLARAQGFDDGQKAEIEGIVRNYLLENPELLVEVLEVLEAKREAETAEAQSTAIAEIGPALFETPEGAVIGNPDGDVTIVEFFDYNCGYCRQAMVDMDAVVAADQNVRFVLKEVPLLGPPSMEAARVSLAVRALAPEVYGEFHRTLLSERGGADGAAALSIAAELGVDEDALRAALDSEAVEAAIAEETEMARALRIEGTPTYVVGNSVIPGARGAEALLEAVANMRDCASATC